VEGICDLKVKGEGHWERKRKIVSIFFSNISFTLRQSKNEMITGLYTYRRLHFTS